MNQKVWNKDFALLTLSNFLICASYYSLVSTLPVYVSRDLLATDSVVGLIMAAYTVSAVLIRPLTGFGLDKLGRKSIFIVSLIAYAVIFGGYLFAVTIALMFLVRFLHGMTWGMATTSNSTIAVDLIPTDKRGEGIGYFGLSTTLGMALGPVFGSLIYQQWGYTGMFLAGLIMGLVSGVMASLIHYPRHVVPKENTELRWKNLFESRTFIPALNILLIITTYGGLVSFIALYGHQIGIANPSIFFLVYAAGVAIARFSSGRVMDKNGPKYILIVCLSLLITGFPLLALANGPVGFYGSAIILGMGNGVMWPTFQTMVNNIAAPGRRGAANSTLFTALDIGMGLGMVLVGIISQYASIPAAFIVCSGMAATGLILFLTVTLPHYSKHLG